jgi:hypothetical protein
MSNFSPFELTPSLNDGVIPSIKMPITNNLKKGNHISMIFLVFILLIGLYTYILYLYMQEKKQLNKKIMTSDNCIGITDEKLWD